MKTTSIARHYLKEAERRLKTAMNALKEKAYAYTVRQSQECTELSLKATLRLVMVEYPKKHDVSDVLEREAKRFPTWFRNLLPKMAKVSAYLAEKRSLAMYGDELKGMGPEELFDEKDAEEALQSAKFVFKNSFRLMKEWAEAGQS